MRIRVATVLAVVALSTIGLASPVAADQPGSDVVDWNQYAVEALFNAPTAGVPGAGMTPPVGGVHLAMVQIAVFDALNAIVDRFEPYIDDLPDAPRSASKAAAIATAAHDVLVGFVPAGNVPAIPAAAITRLDTLLASTLAGIADGDNKEAGKAIGAAAAAAILADRANDGRGGSFRFSVGTEIGEWRPTSGVNDPFAWTKDVRPFTLRRGAQFVTEGPPALGSDQYAVDFNEVKAYGSAGSTVRSAGQTATAMYFTENPFTLFNRSYRALAGGVGLNRVQTARLLAMTNVAGADALIDCWNNKALWSNWRPVTAIALAADDGNAATSPEAGWTPLVVTPPYPDDPSGYNCAAGGHAYAARAFFGTDKMSFNLVNAGGVLRGYDRWSDILDDTIDARIWLGIHFRFADTQGAWLGKKVGQWVGGRFFERIR
jgi:hypothetical protein